MAISTLRVVESHTGSTGSVSEASYTFAFGQAGDTPRGVLVFPMLSYVAMNEVTGVTYGGVALSKVPAPNYAYNISGEYGRVEGWFLGSGLPSGAQNVVVSRVNNAYVHYAVAWLLGGDVDTRVVGTPVAQNQSGVMAPVTIDDGLSSGTSIVHAGGFSGSSTQPTGGGAMNASIGISGTYAYTFASARETTPTFGSRSRGLNAPNDSRAQLVLAVSEIVIPTGILKSGNRIW